jgi:hypothetical protein
LHADSQNMAGQAPTGVRLSLLWSLDRDEHLQSCRAIRLSLALVCLPVAREQEPKDPGAIEHDLIWQRSAAAGRTESAS